MSSMESRPNPRKRSHNLVQGQVVKGRSHRGSRPSGKFNKRPPLLPDTCYRCGKGRHQKAQDCKAVDATCRGCGKKGHYEKVCLQGKCSAHSLETPQANSAGAGASEPLYFNDEGQPVYTYMVSVPHANRIGKFPGMPYKFQLKENAKPVGHAPRKDSYTFTRRLSQGD